MSPGRRSGERVSPTQARRAGLTGTGGQVSPPIIGSTSGLLATPLERMIHPMSVPIAAMTSTRLTRVVTEFTLLPAMTELLHSLT